MYIMDCWRVYGGLCLIFPWISAGKRGWGAVTGSPLRNIPGTGGQEKEEWVEDKEKKEEYKDEQEKKQEQGIKGETEP